MGIAKVPSELSPLFLGPAGNLDLHGHASEWM